MRADSGQGLLWGWLAGESGLVRGLALADLWQCSMTRGCRMAYRRAGGQLGWCGPGGSGPHRRAHQCRRRRPQSARVTLPAFKQLVHTFRRLGTCPPWRARAGCWGSSDAWCVGGSGRCCGRSRDPCHRRRSWQPRELLRSGLGLVRVAIAVLNPNRRRAMHAIFQKDSRWSPKCPRPRYPWETRCEQEHP